MKIEVLGYPITREKIWHLLNLLIYHPAYTAQMAYAIFKVLVKLMIRKEAVTTARIGGIRMSFDLTDSQVRGWYIMTSVPSKEIRVYQKELRPGGVFIDVGANIGFMSAIAASCVGTSGEVHSFEPAPQYYAKLAELANNNPNYQIITNQVALGDSKGTITLNISEGLNIGWNSVVPGFVPQKNIKESIQVPLVRLDDYVAEKGLTKISLAKIDAEGFEFPVLRGMELILKEYKPVILCEIIPSTYRMLDPNSSVDDLFKYMAKFHYEWYMLESKPICMAIFRYREVG